MLSNIHSGVFQGKLLRFKNTTCKSAVKFFTPQHEDQYIS